MAISSISRVKAYQLQRIGHSIYICDIVLQREEWARLVVASCRQRRHFPLLAPSDGNITIRKLYNAVEP